ncbi:hypothetical protein, partial [Neochlamydia sp. AcF95]|uniref:hypothetical protein n=1 Tax=Neochlamydia sp. AcF95 TaxID=2795734 RepID=UPI001BC8F6DD
PPYLNLEKGCLQFSIAATYGVRLNGISNLLKEILRFVGISWCKLFIRWEDIKTLQNSFR